MTATTRPHGSTWTETERSTMKGLTQDRAALGKTLAKHPRGLNYAKAIRQLAICMDLHKSTAMHYVRDHCDPKTVTTKQIIRTFNMQDWRPLRDLWVDWDYDRLAFEVFECIAAAMATDAALHGGE